MEMCLQRNKAKFEQTFSTDAHVILATAKQKDRKKIRVLKGYHVFHKIF